jgi:hypothetical protein
MTDFEERKKQFQKGVDFDEVRRRREEGVVELRKQKRTQHVAKKRAMLTSGTILAIDSGVLGEGVFRFTESMVPGDLAAVCPRLVAQELDHWTRLGTLCDCIVGLVEIGPLKSSVMLLREVLSLDQGAPIDFVGQNPVVEKLVYVLGSRTDQELVFEAAWSLTNLATGSDSTVAHLVTARLIETAATFLKDDDSSTLDQIIWLLSNIAGEAVHYRDLVIAAGVGESVIKRIESRPSMEAQYLTNLCWLLSNLCRGKPAPPDGLATAFFRVLPRLASVGNPSVISNTCWIISYLTDANSTHIQDLLNLKLAPALVNWLNHSDQDVQIPALRSVGNIVTGDDLQTQTMLNLDVLDKLVPLINSSRRCLVKESLWALSNIMAGTPDQINKVYQHHIFAELIKHTSNPDFELKREAIWALCNAFRAEDAKVVMEISRAPQVLESLVQCLEQQDSSLLMVVLKGLNSMFKASKKITTKADGSHELEQRFDHLQGMPMLERLQHHSNPKVYEETLYFMREHFSIEEVADEHDLHSVPEGGFSFA